MVDAANDRNARGFRGRTRLRLVAAQPQCLDPRSYERQARRLAPFRECRVLRQKPVTRMHRVAARRLRRLDQLLDVQVGRRAHAFQRYHLVRLARVQRPGIVRRRHPHRLNA